MGPLGTIGPIRRDSSYEIYQAMFLSNLPRGNYCTGISLPPPSFCFDMVWGALADFLLIPWFAEFVWGSLELVLIT